MMSGMDGGMSGSATVEEIERARAIVGAGERIVVLTGAGISTDSGIPDFRGPSGVWTKNPEAEKMATIEHYLADPEVRRRAWRSRAGNPAWTAEPNAGHLAIVELQRQGRLAAVVTQNVDGLHQKSGVDADRVIEVHGTMWFTRCWNCRDRRPMADTMARLDVGETDPPCLVCGGILKSDTISFGQNLVPEVIDRAMSESEAADVLIAVGSSLGVYPAASCVPLAARAGARIVIVNGQPTALDDLADERLIGEISAILPVLVQERPAP